MTQYIDKDALVAEIERLKDPTLEKMRRYGLHASEVDILEEAREL